MIIHLVVELIKTVSLYKTSYFAESYARSKNKTKFELQLSNYATKSDLEKATDVDTSQFAKKFDLSNLSDAVKNEVVKKTVYDKLVKKVNAIQNTDTINSVKNAHSNTKTAEIKNKILDHDYDEYIPIQEFNNLTAQSFCCKISTSKISN